MHLNCLKSRAFSAFWKHSVRNDHQIRAFVSLFCRFVCVCLTPFLCVRDLEGRRGGVPCACGQRSASGCPLEVPGAATPCPQNVLGLQRGMERADPFGEFLVFISSVHLPFIYLCF